MDSDDEYTAEKKKPRDKFQSERLDHDMRTDYRHWPEQQNCKNAGWNRNDRERSPPYNKRFRQESSDCKFFSTYNPIEYTQQNYNERPNYDMYPKLASFKDKNNHQNQLPVDTTVPISFKLFSQTLEDTIDEAEALKRYNEYKTDLCQTKIEKFFDAHRDEEWFRLKYHPNNRKKRLVQGATLLRNRLKLFKEFLAIKHWDTLSLDINNSDKLVYLMDSIALKLEGESNEALSAILDDRMNNSNDKQVPMINSIALSNLPIDTRKVNLLELLNKLSGFLRVAMTDPYYIEKGSMRRKAFATFKTQKDAMDAYWKLIDMQIGNCKIEATINKQISKRIRSVDGIAFHKSIVKNDLKNAVIIILNLDDARKIWETDALQDDSLESVDLEYLQNDVKVDDENQSSSDDQSTKQGHISQSPLEKKFGTAGTDAEIEYRSSKSKNPLLQNIGRYLVEEANAEEAEYLGYGLPEGEVLEEEEEINDCKEIALEKDEQCLQLLDRLILYLRIVHSFDYYSQTDYLNEDDMPNKLGILYVRDNWNTVDRGLFVTKETIKSYIDSFNAKLKHTTVWSFEDLKGGEQLIVRDAEKEMNSELETWVERKVKDGKQSTVYKCKHCKRDFEQNIKYLMKHVDKKHPHAKAVFQADVDFFNNYLFDPERPDPDPPKKLLEEPTVMLEDSSTVKANNPMGLIDWDTFDKLEEFVKEPAPRGDSTFVDPRAANLVGYDDISFDDAI